MEPSQSQPSLRALRIALIISAIVFFAAFIPGGYGPHLMKNGICYRLLGCNSGFFGYDALVHFTAGIAEALLVIWLSYRFRRLDILHDKRWKSALVIISLVALISVAWEVGELCHDQFRIKVLGENLVAEDRLDQPTNDDTVGDIFFTIVGASLVVAAIRPKEE